MEATFFFCPCCGCQPLMAALAYLYDYISSHPLPSHAAFLPITVSGRLFRPPAGRCVTSRRRQMELSSGAASPAAASHAWVRQEIAAASARDESVRGERTVIRRLTGKERHKNECPRLRLRPVPASQFPAVRGVKHIHTLYLSRKWILM